MSILTTLVLELPCLALHWAGYLLPYSRPLHQQVARAQSRLQDGRPIEGSVKPAERTGRSGARSYQVELFETPAPALPPKDGG